MWEIEPYVPFVELNFGGKEQELGMELPTSDDTRGGAIDEFMIFGRQKGVLAVGEASLDDGVLRTLTELLP